MLAILFATITYVTYGIGDVFGTIATRRINAYSTTLWSLLIGLFLATLAIPFVTFNVWLYSTPILFLNIFIGIIFVIGEVAFTEGLRIGKASLVGTIGASHTSLAVILSLIFLNEPVTSVEILVIILVIAGILLSTINIGEIKKGNVLTKGSALALIAMVCWGLSIVLVKFPIRQVGWFLPVYVTLLTTPTLFIYMKLRGIKLELPNRNKALLPILANGSMQRIGEFTLALALSYGATAIVAPIAGSYPTLFAPLALFVFKDKITKQQLAGLCLTIIGIVLLSFFSS